MTRSRNYALSKTVVDDLPVDGKDTLFWDRDLPGFAVRVYASGNKVYMVQTRAFGRSRRVNIGSPDDIPYPKAREIAADVIYRIKTGQPPFPAEPALDPTVADLAERYMREYVELRCKPATVTHYRHVLGKHIVPGLGERLVRHVTHGDIVAFQISLYHMPTVANRTVDMLSKMFKLADQWGWRPSGTNPCKGVPRYRIERRRERVLTREELFRLGEAIRAAPAEGLASAHAATAIYLLVLTGCRRNEILELQWDDLNFDSGEMRLRDSKSGPRMVAMPRKAAEVFAGLARTPGSPWVFPGKKSGRPLKNLNDSWYRIRKRAGLDDVRLHDLRHTYASRALALGEGLPMIGELLGHQSVRSTARYAHPDQDAARKATARIGENIGAWIMPRHRG